ncbi:MAG: glycosyltransferase [Candidatus Saganbacteria bacterium]|nr:glycosyltransferase [Candidatus Saganbacteria bacterium]
MKKIAIVHDYLNQFGGAERVVAALHDIFPDAPIYTSIYDEKRMPEIFKQMDIRTSFMQKLPFVMQKYRYYFWFYPKAIESFDLSEYDLVLSSSSAYAKGAKKRKDALHVCYCHNPMRFVWRYDDYIKQENINIAAKKLLPFFLDRLKKWDLQTNNQVDYFIANSRAVAKRISSFYNRESAVINPPIETKTFSPDKNNKNYFLIVSRLLGYKRIDIAIEAFSRLGLPLKIVGDGPARKTLKKSASLNIEFLGLVDDVELKRLYSECRALLFTGEEDFGMVPLEGAASGRPTIAYKRGGALETIVDQKTGLFFKEQSVDSLLDAVARFEKISFDRDFVRKHAQKFDKIVFREKIIGFLNETKAL